MMAKAHPRPTSSMPTSPHQHIHHIPHTPHNDNSKHHQHLPVPMAESRLFPFLNHPPQAHPLCSPPDASPRIASHTVHPTPTQPTHPPNPQGKSKSTPWQSHFSLTKSRASPSPCCPTTCASPCLPRCGLTSNAPFASAPSNPPRRPGTAPACTGTSTSFLFPFLFLLRVRVYGHKERKRELACLPSRRSIHPPTQPLSDALPSRRFNHPPTHPPTLSLYHSSIHPPTHSLPIGFAKNVLKPRYKRARRTAPRRRRALSVPCVGRRLRACGTCCKTSWVGGWVGGLAELVAQKKADALFIRISSICIHPIHPPTHPPTHPHSDDNPRFERLVSLLDPLIPADDEAEARAMEERERRVRGWVGGWVGGWVDG